MSQPSPGLIRVVRAIDRFTDTVGSGLAWLALVLTCSVVYNATLRGFGAPSLWAYEFGTMVYGTFFMLGTAYALHKGAHIRTDFFWEKWSIRTKGIIDSIAYIVFFFPALIVFGWVGAVEAWYSFQIGETSDTTPWRPILWPFKSVVPLAALFLIVQGVSETIKSVYAWRTGIELEHKEKVEI